MRVKKALSVDKVLSVFVKATTDLNTVIEQQDAIVVEQHQIMDLAVSRRDTANAEANRAKIVQAKLSELIDF